MLVPTAPNHRTGDLEMLSYPELYITGFAWAEMEPFTAVMRVVGYERGRSAARFVLVDQATGHIFPMFLTDAIEMIKTCDLHNGETANVWEPCKRGSNYGIRISK